MDNKNKITLIENSNLLIYLLYRNRKNVYVYSGFFPGAKRLPYDFIGMVEHYLSHYKAGTVIHEVYDEYIKEDESRMLNEIMGDERASLVIKKTILYSLGYLFYRYILAEKFLDKYKVNESVDFIPQYLSHSLYKIIEKKGLLLKHINIPSWYLMVLKYIEGLQNILYRLAFIANPILLSLKMKVIKYKHSTKLKYKYAMPLWDTAFGLSLPLFFDLLVDGNNLKHEDILYVMEKRINKTDLKRLKEKGYNNCYFKEMVSSLGLREYFINCYPEFAEKGMRFFFKGSRKALLNEAYLKNFMWYILWEMFYKNYDIDLILAVQEAGNVPRTLIQEKHGSKNIFVFLTCCYDPVYRENMVSHGDSYYSFMAYENMATSKVMIDYCKLNNNFIKEYTDIGVIRSDAVYRVNSDSALKNKIKRELKIPKDKVLISFFDTSIGRNGFYNNEEGLNLFTDVCRLLESNENYYLIYKSRSSEMDLLHNCDAERAIARLRTHERVLYFGDRTNPYSTEHFMGISDLVIGVFGSSAPQECASAGVRSIAYVPSERFDKDVFLISSFPYFCARGYDELKKYSDYWLNECSEEDFSRFQDKYIKKYIDTHCDGRATERFYSLLRASRNNKHINVAVDGNELQPVLIK